MLRLVLWAAAHLSSLAAACASLAKAPSDQAARDALLATLPEFAELQRRLNRVLAAGLPKALYKKRQRLAIDLHLIPYYGRPEASPGELYKGAAKAGTKYFHAYATAYVVRKGCRWTLALTTLSHTDPWDDVVRRLLRQVAKTGVKVGLVLLDRGFYSVKVIRYLQQARYPFILPVLRRGRQPDHPKGPSGTRTFFTWKRSGWSEHTLRDQQGRHATVTIAVCGVRPKPSRRRPDGGSKKRRRQVWVYAVWGIGGHSLEWVRQTYRQRFGIETSYRQLGQARARTNSRSPLLRLLYVGVALVLRNVWVWRHWEVLAQQRRGYRRLRLRLLPLEQMLRWLAQAVEALLGLRQSVAASGTLLT